MQCAQIHATARTWAGMAKNVARHPQAFFSPALVACPPAMGPLPLKLHGLARKASFP